MRIKKASFQLKYNYPSVYKGLFIAIFLLFQVNYSFSQDQTKNEQFYPNLQLGASWGTSIFFGDIKQNPVIPISDNMSEWRFAYGLNFNYSFSYVLTMRMQGLYGKLSGTNREGKIWFENDYYELNFNAAINFNNLFGRKRVDRMASIYGIAGFGMMNYNTVVKRLGDYFIYKRVGYGYGTGIEGRQRQEFFMAGAGIDFRISKRFNILLETVNKFTSTDELDGVESGKYYDFYNYTSVGLVYRFSYLKKEKKQGKLKTERITYPVQLIEPVSISILLSFQPNYSFIYPTIRPLLAVELQDEPGSYSTAQSVSHSTIEYRVQIRAEYAKPLSKSSLGSKFNILISDIKEDIVNNYYVYSTGSFRTYDEAQIKCSELRKQNGIKDAFIVGFKDGLRTFPETK